MSADLQPPQPSLSPLAQTLRFKKDPMGFMAQVRTECGDIFSLRLLGMGRWVVIASPAILGELYELPEDQVVAGEIRGRMLGAMVGEQASIVLDGEEYARRRRITSPFFSGRAVFERVPAGLNENGVLPKSPEWSLNASMQYAFEAGALGDVIARADWSYRDDVFNDVQNTPALAQEAYALLNARVLVSPAEHWEVSLFGTNLTDEAYLETGIFTGAFGPSIGIPARPREWGASVQFSF